MIPSLEHFATHDNSDYPHLWESVALSLAPCLGVQGPRVLDHSRQNNHGQLVNMDPATDWVLDNGRYALNISASTNKHLEVVNARRSLDLGPSGFTVSTWCKPTAAATSVGRDVINLFFSSVASPPYISYGIEYRSSNNWTFSIGVNGTTYLPLGSTVGYPINNLYHVAGVYTGASQQVYVNGVLAASAAETRPVFYNGSSLFIGRYTGQAFADESFVGPIFEVLLHRRALLPNEISELWQIGPGGMYTPKIPHPMVFDFGSSLRRRLLMTGQT